MANLSISGLQDNVITTLRNNKPIPVNKTVNCVFWDVTLNDGSGGWNDLGCSVLNVTEEQTICSCSHLNSFATVLQDRYGIPIRDSTHLQDITLTGLAISSIFLAVTLVTYLAFKELRQDNPSKILIHLCFALLLLNMTYLQNTWVARYSDVVGLCISTAFFLHYFLLCTFTWMGLEAICMYISFVKVFHSISCFTLKLSLIGWGIPLAVVIIVIAIDKNNYGLISYEKSDDGTTDGFCWLQNYIVQYVAVMAYFCVIFLLNLVIFVVVLVQLCRIKRRNPHNMQHHGHLQNARSVPSLTVLLGLTWGFIFPIWGEGSVSLAFMYLFTIFNTLQGFFIFVFHCAFFIFVFHCAMKGNVRRQWRTCFSKLRQSCILHCEHEESN